MVFINCILCFVLDNRAWRIGVLIYTHGMHMPYRSPCKFQTWGSCSGFCVTAGEPNRAFWVRLGHTKWSEILDSWWENRSGSYEEVSPLGFAPIVPSPPLCTSASTLSITALMLWATERPVTYVFPIKTHVLWTKEETVSRSEESRQTHFMCLKKRKERQKSELTENVRAVSLGH